MKQPNHLNFTQAVYDLEVTQTVVIQQVRLLEDELVIKIFERLNHGLKLTKLLIGYVYKVCDILKNWHRILSSHIAILSFLQTLFC